MTDPSARASRLRAYLSLKYHADQANRARIEALSDALQGIGIETYCVARDLELWGARRFSARDLMQRSLQAMLASDIVLIDFSEKGVGIGIEAGYAHAHRRPVIVIVPATEMLSTTLLGIADGVIVSTQPDDTIAQLRGLIASLDVHASRHLSP